MARSPAITAIAAAALMLGVARAAAADLLLVERPGSLVILDRYQQTMSPQARRRLTPFAPMIVRNTLTHLGDGITPSMAVEIDGEPCSLILEESGDFAGQAQAGYVRLVRGAELAADTVEILTPLQFTSPDRRSGRRLAAGDRLAMLFRTGGEAYVRRLGGGFGWVPATGSAWRSLRISRDGVPSARHRELEIIRSSLDSANALFVSLFSRLDMEQAYPSGPPRWVLEDSGGVVHCVLTGLKAAGEAGFTESTEMLARELQTSLLGRGMSVSSRPGVITIRYLNSAQETH